MSKNCEDCSDGCVHTYKPVDLHETYVIRRKDNHTIAYGASFTSREAAEMKRLEIDRDDELEVV